MSAITVDGLTKHYPTARWGRGARHPIHALEDVTLEVRPGEIFGFLGPNGAGKSTLIRLLLGYLHPTAGRARVLGLDIVRESVAIRARTGYLPGGIALDDGLTGERYLDDLAALSGLAPVRREEICERLELTDRVLRRPIRGYSRGMRQKVGIVQALQHDPELAILDEPSEGLDPLMQRAFYEVLDDLRAAGRTVFFSSHILSEVERVCDRVAIVRGGRLVATEDVGMLLAQRKRRVELQFDGAAPALAGIEGVSGLSVEHGRLTCSLAGDPRPFLAAIAGAAVTDLAIEPSRLEDAFLELYAGEEAAEIAADREADESTGAHGARGDAGDAGDADPADLGNASMTGPLSLPLLRRTWRAQRSRLALVAVALGVWAFLMPVIYATFGRQLAAILDTGIIPDAFLRLMGADPFSLVGAVALGWVHPITIGLQVIFPIGLGAAAIAGERQRGSLEVLLSRPLSRRRLFATDLAALVAFATLTTLATVAGTVAGAAAYGVAGELDAGALAFLAVNTVLQLAAFAAIALAASASFDRLAPALGVGLVVLLLGYVLEILGTLWPDAAFLQPYSPFHYLRPLEILSGRAELSDLAVLAGITVAATAWGLWHFPRRDLAAPT